jgi:small subunit ribosomal protein S20
VANHKDAVKRALQSEKLRVKNRAYRTRMRNQIKKLRTMITGADGSATEALQTEFREAVSLIQKLAAKGVIHRNQAARRVARLAAAVKIAGTAQPKAIEADAAPKKKRAAAPKAKAAPKAEAAAKPPAAARKPRATKPKPT